MDEVIACRVSTEEKLLAQALAERRDQYVASLLRDLLLAELEENFGAGHRDRENQTVE